MSQLLARHAESLFWLARYIERAENLARILDVQTCFARDSKGAQDWGVVLAINADHELFFARHARTDAADVLSFYVLERDNPTSIAASLHQARENARALRPLISTEMWVQLNIFYNRIRMLRPVDVSEERLARLCALIKESCDAHAGITAGTFYRDEAWCFYELGAALECADQTTRLLDAKFLSAAARAEAGAEMAPGSAVDVSYWTALLRAAAGYQAYRRRHPRGMAPEEVAVFMLLDASFPRSVAFNMGRMEAQLHELRRRYGLRAAGRALERLDHIRYDLTREKLHLVVAQGRLHQYNDWLQRCFAEVTSLIAHGFFGQAPVSKDAASPVPPPASGTTQTQRQG